jgi:hypothetical protein
MRLNTEQQEAVDAGEGAFACLAGPKRVPDPNTKCVVCGTPVYRKPFLLKKHSPCCTVACRHKYNGIVSQRPPVLLDGKEVKKCCHCKITKPLEEFAFNNLSRQERHRQCRKCYKVYNAENRHKYRLQKNRQSREQRAALRLEILVHYSDSVFPFCACCNESHEEFLSIDHINGGGGKHKREVRHVYAWLKRNNFPQGFRVLCHNCNQSLGAYGYCPHQAKHRTN